MNMSRGLAFVPFATGLENKIISFVYTSMPALFYSISDRSLFCIDIPRSPGSDISLFLLLLLIAILILFYRIIMSFYRVTISFYRIIIVIYRNKYSDISTYYCVLSNYYFDILRFIEIIIAI